MIPEQYYHVGIENVIIQLLSAAENIIPPSFKIKLASTECRYHDQIPINYDKFSVV